MTNPVGAAMWGGRPWEPPPPDVPQEEPPADYPATVGTRDVVSIAATVAGGVASTAGASVLWGAGGGLLTGGLLTVILGVLIGVT